jgi:hypothetical protein
MFQAHLGLDLKLYHFSTVVLCTPKVQYCKNTVCININVLANLGVIRAHFVSRSPKLFQLVPFLRKSMPFRVINENSDGELV